MKIQGLDLSIDPNIQKLCEVYNQSSGATRSVLYVALIISIISLVSVFNGSWTYNWTKDRIDDCKSQIIADNLQIENLKNQCFLTAADKLKLSSLSFSVDSVKKRMDLYLRADVEDNKTVKISIIGMAIDINDLSGILGFSLTVLLFILRFTLHREKDNLIISLYAINERYPPNANFHVLKELYLKEYRAASPSEEQWLEVIPQLNKMRRRFHYNFLSMNEVFSLPELETPGQSTHKLRDKLSGKFVNNNLFYFFLIIYSYVIFNDFCSVGIGVSIQAGHTALILSLSFFFYISIHWLCRKCIRQKRTINELFGSFHDNNYTYLDKDYGPPERRFYVVLLWPVGLIIGLIALSILVARIFPNETITKGIKELLDSYSKWLSGLHGNKK